MKTTVLNTAILVLLALIVTGAGYYLTEVRQPQVLYDVEASEREANLRNREVEELLQMEAQSAEVAETTLAKWRSRYKVIPEKLETPDVNQYLAQLTSAGFEQLVIDFKGAKAARDVSSYTFNVSGLATFSSLYGFIWRLENDRQMYRISNLQMQHEELTEQNPVTKKQRRKDRVGFSVDVDAYFGGASGLNPESEALADLPADVLPRRSPAHDSFYPLVRVEAPSNDRGLLDVEEARLVSIVGGSAIFEDRNGRYEVEEGDEVYLGTIVKVDPIRAYVRVSLNRGGVMDVVEIRLNADQQLRLPGQVRRTPIQEGGQ